MTDFSDNISFAAIAAMPTSTYSIQQAGGRPGGFGVRATQMSNGMGVEISGNARGFSVVGTVRLPNNAGAALISSHYKAGQRISTTTTLDDSDTGKTPNIPELINGKEAIDKIGISFNQSLRQFMPPAAPTLRP
jgi:hypothetical protein